MSLSVGQVAGVSGVTVYVDDPRFKARYDGIAPGLAEYSRDAFAANAERHGK